jgi:hypothetical protein
MFDNLTLIVVLIILLWVGLFAFYIYTSRQQEHIGQEIDALNNKLDKK